MIGRERRAQLQVGEHARAQRLGQRHAVRPGVGSRETAAGQDQRPRGAAQQRYGRVEQLGRGRRAIAGTQRGVDRRQRLPSGASCIPASRLT